MKKLLLLLSFILAFTTVQAQKAVYKAAPEKLVAQQDVFEVSGRSAAELYQLTKKWMANVYTNPQKVTKLDEENQTLKINYHFDITSPKKVKVKYNLQFEFKDNKVRVTFIHIGDTYYTKYTKFFDENGTPKKSKSVQKSIVILENHVDRFVDDYVSFLKTNDKW